MIEQLLKARADEMAAHDGVAATTTHVHGAANQLQAELISARDRLIHHAGSEHAPTRPATTAQPEPAAAAEEPVVETAAAPKKRTAKARKAAS